jgi:gliding motility-associated lipoprotein GldD
MPYSKRQNMPSRFASLAGILLLFFAACDTYTPYPRPMGFPRIELPATTVHKTFQNTPCPFTFEYPDFGEFTRNSEDSCWVDITFPQFDGTWHIAYRNTDAIGKTRSELYEEYRNLMYFHTKKADRIIETPVSGPTGYGMLFEMYGEVGTPAQFFFSDSTGSQVIMNSFYYRTALKNDSLHPVSVYMKRELAHMIQSIQWSK